ncbi:MAG: MBL fold metallo-hydrolase [Pseudomonadota bacterium]
MSLPLTLRFWGVRGSLPVPGTHTQRYGGNTSCLEIRHGEHLIIVDCGSGAYPLGKRMMETCEMDADLLFTHTHQDHVCGLPFFKPAYSAEAEIRCWAGHLDHGLDLNHVLSWLMAPALFPVPVDSLQGCRLNTFIAGDTLDLAPGLTVRTMMLNHPGGAVGYRLEGETGVLAVITDHEHGHAEIDAALPDFVEGADVMVYDANYTDEEYAHHVGWGHSTWNKGLELARTAGVKKTFMFHHAPHRTDDQLDRLAGQMAGQSPSAVPATEGLTVIVGRN